MSRQAAAEEAQRGTRGRTARERWQLVRLVSRIGTQLRQKPVSPDGTWQAGDETPMVRNKYKLLLYKRRCLTNK
jgi:hypothetical protein